MDFIVIGIGSAGQRYAQLLTGFGQTVVAVADPILPDDDKGPPRAYTSPEKCLRDESVGRGVVIASPHKFHATQAMLAIDNGCRALLIEKPMATNADAAAEVAKAARTMGVKGCIGYNYRFHQAVQLTVSHKFARPAFLCVNACEDVRTWPGYGPDSYLKDPENRGLLFTAVTHMVDMAIRILGPATYVRGFVEGKAGDEEQNVLIRSSHGKEGNQCLITAGWSDRRYFVFNYIDQANTITMDINSPKLRSSLGTMHADLLKAFLGYVHGGPLGELVSLETGLQNVRLMDAVWRSHSSGRVLEVERD